MGRTYCNRGSSAARASVNSRGILFGETRPLKAANRFQVRLKPRRSSRTLASAANHRLYGFPVVRIDAPPRAGLVHDAGHFSLGRREGKDGFPHREVLEQLARQTLIVGHVE